MLGSEDCDDINVGSSEYLFTEGYVEGRRESTSEGIEEGSKVAKNDGCTEGCPVMKLDWCSVG